MSEFKCDCDNCVSTSSGGCMPCLRLMVNTARPPASIPVPPRQPSEKLTKREMFAMAAMQGILSSSITSSSGDGDVARWSVSVADDLLAELERTK